MSEPPSETYPYGRYTEDDLAYELAVKRRHEAELLARPGVTGVDVGLKWIAGQLQPSISIRVYVRKKGDLAGGEPIPAAIEGVPTDVVEEGELVLGATYSLTPTERAVHDYAITGTMEGGWSISREDHGQQGSAGGHYGTLGLVCTDRASGAPLLLTNFHVVWAANAQKGDRMCQPGRGYYALVPEENMGTLDRWVLPTDEVGAVGNQIDAAAVRLTARSYRGTMRGVYLPGTVTPAGLSGLTADPVVGDIYQTCGARSGYKRVMCTGFGKASSISIPYDIVGHNVSVTSHEQMTLIGDPTWTEGAGFDQSAGMSGDSGSVIIKYIPPGGTGTLDAVGLFYASDGRVGPTASAYAGKIRTALDALNLNIATNPVALAWDAPTTGDGTVPTEPVPPPTTGPSPLPGSDPAYPLIDPVRLAQCVDAARQMAPDWLEAFGMIGIDAGYRQEKPPYTNEPVIRVHVDPDPPIGLPGSFGGFPVVVFRKPGGKMVAALAPDGSDDRYYDPVKGGCAHSPCSSVNQTGTLGCLVVERGSGVKMGLSNYHVYYGPADTGTGVKVIQPGLVEGGKCPRHHWTDVVRGVHDGPSGLDCAVSSLATAETRMFPRDGLGEIIDIGGVAGSAPCTAGVVVRKRGRTTILTQGGVTGVGGQFNVTYTLLGVTAVIPMHNMITVETTKRFAKAGDSGSVLVDNARRVVGLFSACNDAGTHSIACHIQPVLDALNVDVLTSDAPPVSGIPGTEPKQPPTTCIPFLFDNSVDNPISGTPGSGVEGQVYTFDLQLNRPDGVFDVIYNTFTNPDMLEALYEGNVVWTTGGFVGTEVEQKASIAFGPGTATVVTLRATLGGDGSEFYVKTTCARPPGQAVEPAPYWMYQPYSGASWMEGCNSPHPLALRYDEVVGSVTSVPAPTMAEAPPPVDPNPEGGVPPVGYLRHPPGYEPKALSFAPGASLRLGKFNVEDPEGYPAFDPNLRDPEGPPDVAHWHLMPDNRYWRGAGRHVSLQCLVRVGVGEACLLAGLHLEHMSYHWGQQWETAEYPQVSLWRLADGSLTWKKAAKTNVPLAPGAPVATVWEDCVGPRGVGVLRTEAGVVPDNTWVRLQAHLQLDQAATQNVGFGYAIGLGGGWLRVDGRFVLNLPTECLTNPWPGETDWVGAPQTPEQHDAHPRTVGAVHFGSVGPASTAQVELCDLLVGVGGGGDFYDPPELPDGTPDWHYPQSPFGIDEWGVTWFSASADTTDAVFASHADYPQNYYPFTALPPATGLGPPYKYGNAAGKLKRTHYRKMKAHSLAGGYDDGRAGITPNTHADDDYPVEYGDDEYYTYDQRFMTFEFAGIRQASASCNWGGSSATRRGTRSGSPAPRGAGASGRASSRPRARWP